MKTVNLVPIYSEASASKFVSVDKLKPWTVRNTETGEEVLSSALVVGEKIDLIGLCRTEDLNNNIISIDPWIQLRAVFIEDNEGRICREDTSNLPYTTFTFSKEGNYRQAELNFQIKAALLTEFSDEESFGPNDLLVGYLNFEFGSVVVYGPRFDKEKHKAKVIGYELAGKLNVE